MRSPEAINYTLVRLPRTTDSDPQYRDLAERLFCHPLFAWLGLRVPRAQHTANEHAILRKWAAGRETIVEIGVAEGVSGAALREVMSPTGTLFLIDPFHLSRLPALNFLRRAAHRAVHRVGTGRVVWIEKFSHQAIKDWNAQIDFLLIDGDHSDAGVERDWHEWSPYIRPGGVVLFHDARLFEGGWTTLAYGPVKLVDRLFRVSPSRDWAIVDEIDSIVVVQKQH